MVWDLNCGRGRIRAGKGRYRERIRSVGVPSRQRGYCRLCAAELHGQGREQPPATCPGRCTDAWQALEALRALPGSERLAELLQAVWRAGVWRVRPEALLAKLGA